MTELGAALFAALLGLALVCRLRPPAAVLGAVERLLGFFAIEPADPALAAADLLGAAGAAGFGFLFAIERSGWSLDAVLLADLALSALGTGLAVTWLIARVHAPTADPWGEEPPRALFTEPDPRLDDAPGPDG